MIKWDTGDLIKEYSRITGKFILYISWYEPDYKAGVHVNYWEEAIKAAPYLSMDDTTILVNQTGILVFDSEEEMNIAFWQTIGDNGPTETNSYNGPIKIYATTCVNGEFMNENT
jgi:hypothetical protein